MEHSASPQRGSGPRHSILDLAPLELECMSVLWPLGEGNWTAFSGALERRFLRVDLFRRAEESAAKDAPSHPPPLKSLGAKD